MIVVDILLLVLLHVAVLAGMAAIVLGLSGNFILLGLALLVAWLGKFLHLSVGLWFVLLVLAVGGEVVEAFLGVAAARTFGATRWGMIGAFLGGLAGAALGTLWIPVLGSLVGAVLGAFAGAFAGERVRGTGTRASVRAGTGALLGRAAATVFKVGIGIFIAVCTLRAAYPLV
jgi:uncharacterized protein YqgC (DUF456 family)